MRRVIFSLFVLTTIFVGITGAYGATIHVPGDEPTIQAGIDAASDGDTVLVEYGTYNITSSIDFGGKNIKLASDDGTNSSYEEAATDAEQCIIDAGGNVRVFYFHNDETSEAVVDGFTIRNGNTDGKGGGIYSSSSPTIMNNIITENSADYYGGGIYCGRFSSPTIINNIISGNSAGCGGGIGCFHFSCPTITNNIIIGNLVTDHGGGVWCYQSSPTIATNTITKNSANRGGGIACVDGSAPTIINNTITENSANQDGGIYCYSSSCPIIMNNIITGNSVYQTGGGIGCYSSSPIITNNIITENSAGWYGGGIGCYTSSSPMIANNTITGNLANNHDGGISGDSSTSPTITNTIFWANFPNEISHNLAVTYSDIQGGFTGEGNIDADPLFFDADGGDYHLRDSSPCIGAGTIVDAPDHDIESNPRPNPADSDPDIGAYENSHGSPVPQNIYVSTTGDDTTGDGSETNPFRTIQKGIDAAKDGDTVLVADGTYTEAHIIVDKDLTMQGYSADNTIVQAHESEGSASSNVFHIPSDKTVSIKDMTIQHGNAGGGGGIGNDGTLSVINCVVRNNRAGSTDCGGGINNSGNLTLINCTVSENQAGSKGGGISNGDSMTVINCTINDNQAGYRGGGIANAIRGLELTNCTISGNQASENGGGVYNGFSGTLTLTNCTVSGNQAEYRGGGIYNYSIIYIKNTILANNTANERPTNDFHNDGSVNDNGYNIVERSSGYTFNTDGDITGGQDNLNLSDTLEYNDTINGTKTLKITDGSVAIDAGDPNNTPNSGVEIPTTDQRGFARIGRTDIGAYENPQGSPVARTLYVSTTGNDSNDGLSWQTAKQTIQAGIDAAKNGDTVLVADGTYTGKGNKKLDFKGKAIIVTSENGAESTIIDCEDNERGFRFVSGEDSSSVVSGFTIRNGNGHHYGGAIFCSESSPTIKDNIITMNTASINDPADSSYGGGIYCAGAPSPMIIVNNTITKNSADCGGGIYGYAIIDSNTISENTAGRGAAIHGGHTIKNNTISENTASGGGIIYGSSTIKNNTITKNIGNGIHILEGASPMISNNIISENSGRGIFSSDSSPTISNNIISGNTTEGWGGGIACYGASVTITITNNIITGNSAVYGGAISSDCRSFSTVTITNNTVSGNKASQEGGGIYCNGDPPTVLSTILWNNSPDEISFGYQGSITITYSDIQGGWEGEGNIDVDPMFVAPESGDYHLQAGSPCIDAGTSDGAPSDDIDENPRDGFPDIGAYEYIAPPDTTPPTSHTISSIQATSSTQINLTSTQAQDDTPPVYYQIDGQFHDGSVWTDNSGGVSDYDYSTIRPNPWSDTNLVENGWYRYRQKVKDSIEPPNESEWSDWVERATLLNQPQDAEISFANVTATGMDVTVASPPKPSGAGETGAYFDLTTGQGQGSGAIDREFADDYTAEYTNLNPNTQYGWKVKYRNREGVETDYNQTEQKRYTLANTPLSPIVSNPTQTTLDVEVNPNGNPDYTLFAIYNITDGHYIDADGSSTGGTPIWQTKSDWGTVTVVNLSQGKTYEFKCKAQNNGGIETPWGASGSGTTKSLPSPDISVDATSLDFGKVSCRHSTNRFLTISNKGNTDLEVTNITADKPDFRVSETSFTITSNGSHEITVTFTPQSEGEVTGNLTIESNDPDEETLEVPITGKGVLYVNRALSLDGDGDYVDLGKTIQLTSSFSICAWVKCGSQSNNDPPIVECVSYDGDYHGYRLFIEYNDGKPGLSNYSVAGGHKRVNAITNVTDNDWHFIVATYDNSTTTQQMYIDGILEGTNDTALDCDSASENTVFGRRERRSDRYYDGIIDEIRLYNYALTQEQIRSNMYTPLTGKEDGLVGYWRFDEETGTSIAYDSSPNANHGTLFGDADFVVSERPTTGIFAQITNPTSNSYHKGTLEIRGSAKVIDGTLLNWQLYYAPGDWTTQTQGNINPLSSAWVKLTRESEPVDNNLLYSWDTTELNQIDKKGDLYTLRLWVDDTEANRKEKMVLFTIDNVKPETPSVAITSLSGGSEYIKNNDTITISGTVEETELEIASALLIIGSEQIDISDDISIEGTTISGNIDDVGEISGPVKVVISVQDKTGNVSDEGKSNSLLSDNEKPNVEIHQPAYGANFQSIPITIEGIASDSLSGVDKVEIKFGTDDWKQVNGTTNWIYRYDPREEFPNKEDSECNFKVRSHDSVGNISDEFSYWIQFYSDEPAANIIQPIDSASLSGLIEVTGNASERFVLDYAEGEDPSDTADWITIKDSSSPAGGFFSIDWNVSNLSGIYTLRLTVNGDISTITVNRKNLHIYPPGKTGDVNDDGVVDAKDATEILRHVVGLPPADQFIEDRADVSKNGLITAYDAAMIYQKVAGLIDQ